MVNWDKIITPARISGLACVIHARRFRVVRKSSNEVLFCRVSVLDVKLFCFRKYPVFVLLIFKSANRNGDIQEGLIGRFVVFCLLDFLYVCCQWRGNHLRILLTCLVGVLF